MPEITPPSLQDATSGDGHDAPPQVAATFNRRHGKTSWVIDACFCMCLLAIAGSDRSHCQTVWTDWRQKARPFRQRYQARFDRLRSAAEKGERHVDVEPIDKVPKSLEIFDVTNVLDYWRNRAVATYFGLDTVRRVTRRQMGSTDSATKTGEP